MKWLKITLQAFKEVCPDYGVESPFSGETNGEELDQTDLKNMNQCEAPHIKIKSL